MIAKTTKQPQLVNPRTNLNAIIRGRITERLTTDDAYLVVGIYEYKTVTTDQEGVERIEWTSFESFQRSFTTDEVKGLHTQLSSMVTGDTLPEIYDSLCAIALGVILEQEGSWGLTQADWE